MILKIKKKKLSLNYSLKSTIKKRLLCFDEVMVFCVTIYWLIYSLWHPVCHYVIRCANIVAQWGHKKTIISFSKKEDHYLFHLPQKQQRLIDGDVWSFPLHEGKLLCFVSKFDPNSKSWTLRNNWIDLNFVGKFIVIMKIYCDSN